MREKISLFWQELPLNKKLTSLLLGVIALPLVLCFSVFLDTIEREEEEYLSQSAISNLEKLQTFAFSNSSIASAVISLVHSNPQLKEALSNELSTWEILDFHSDVTSYLESISITNPYIRSLRVYSETMPERYPVFLDSSRVKEEAWFQEATENFIQLRINYSESLSSQINQYTGEHLISFYKAQGENAVVEVSFTLENFFGDVFTDTTGICLVESEEGIFLWEGHTGGESLFSLIDSYGKEAIGASIVVNHGGNYLITGKFCPDLQLNYYIIHDLSQELRTIENTRILFVLLFFLLFLVLAFLFEKISSMLLSQIYVTIDAMHQLETGDTLVQIKNPGKDELGQLQQYFNVMVVQIDQLITKESQRAMLEKDAQLKALQNQINAHFLYNVLNNIEMMAIVEENFLIADSVTALARLLRYSMKWDHQMEPLAHELDYVKDYVQLFNMRFDNEISLICDLAPETEKAFIPKMSVQPVVENAIIHGIEERMSDEIIRIATKIQGNHLIIGITDTGVGIAEETLEKLQDTLATGSEGGGVSGIGLHNVAERIENCFGKEYGIEIQSQVGEYTKVTIKIPYLEESP